MHHRPALLLALTAATTAAPAATPAPPEAYAPLAFLVGHCWKGTFPGGSVTDEHCFSWIYGGRFVRDRHVLHRGGGRPEDRGESIYLWDAGTKELQYLYIESGGGFMRGTVTPTADALVFPAARYSEGGQEQMVRSRWQRSGGDAYEVATEFQVKGQWQTGFSVHMQRTGTAPAD